MTFPEATTFANESGWYIQYLGQNLRSEGFSWDHWECTIRAIEGPPRRQISRGKGHTPEDAIIDALTVAPELERETTIYRIANLRESDMSADLLALIGTKPLQPTRTRA